MCRFGRKTFPTHFPPVQEIVGALISSGLAIRNISMASNDIGDAGVGSLARLLDDEPPSYSSVLSSLDLRGNSIGSKGCQVSTCCRRSLSCSGGFLFSGLFDVRDRECNRPFAGFCSSVALQDKVGD